MERTVIKAESTENILLREITPHTVTMLVAEILETIRQFSSMNAPLRLTQYTFVAWQYYWVARYTIVVWQYYWVAR